MFNFAQDKMCLETLHFFFFNLLTKLTKKSQWSNSLFSQKEDFEAFLSIMYGNQEAESVIIEHHHSSLTHCSTSLSCENAILLNQAGRGSRVAKITHCTFKFP